MKAALGSAHLGGGRTSFSVWAPGADEVTLHIQQPRERSFVMERDAFGYHTVVAESVWPGTLYKYRLDRGEERADPASRLQPQGLHGPSEVVEASFDWHDTHWQGIPVQHYIIYELHVGAFTPEGDFVSVISKLPYLKQLGVTAVELMPVAQFPGTRNWGYDGAYPFAAQDSYGGPDGLKSLVNACHEQGLAVILDVVYNHLGPEGNYLSEFGPYFTDRYQTPWGAAINFDGPDSDHVRRFFIENALYWVTDCHIDALRLDALHAILDVSPYTFLQELAETVHERAVHLNRRIHLFGESDLNDVRLIRVPELGGYGLDGQWNDDFHHILHVLLTGESGGYYQAFGGVVQMAKAYSEGFVYSGQYSMYRRRRHGISSKDVPAERFVVFAQNHDQVGNRMQGDRLSSLVPLEALKLAAGVVLLSPCVPLLFMGEEYGEKAPFPYFISHSDPDLAEAVREGRRREFAAFNWDQELPDAQSEDTFRQATLNWHLVNQSPHKELLEFYRSLIVLRKRSPALAGMKKAKMDVVVFEKEKVLHVRRWSHADTVIVIFNFQNEEVHLGVPFSVGRWTRLIDSSDARWGGEGSRLPETLDSSGSVDMVLKPCSVAVYSQTGGK